MCLIMENKLYSELLKLKHHYALNGGNTIIMQRLNKLLADYENKFNA